MKIPRNCTNCKYFKSFAEDYFDDLESNNQGFCLNPDGKYYYNEGAGIDKTDCNYHQEKSKSGIMETIPAIITSITPKVLASGHLLDKPKIDYDQPWDRGQMKYFERRLKDYESSAFTAEVKNVAIDKKDILINKHRHGIELNQSCMITIPVDGKCKIVELK